MSSQGSSSVKVFSGAAFVGDPLFEEVSTPNISFTELASISSRVNEEEGEEEVVVNYTNLRSTITGEDSVQIATCYSLEVLMPYELERLHHPSEGYVTLSKTYLKFWVRFPLHPFFMEVLKYFGLTVL